MRILLVAPSFPPENSPGALRAYGFAKYWARAGEHVDVVSVASRCAPAELALPFEGFRVVPLAHRSGLAARLLGGPRMRALRARGVGSGVRMPDTTDPWVGRAAAWVDAQAADWDFVVSSFSPYTAHQVGLHVLRRGRARFWAADFRDPWVDNHAYAGLFPFTLIERALEKRCFERAALVTTVAPQLADRMRQRHGRPVHTIYNAHDPELTRDLPAEPRFPRDGRIRLVYTGHLYERGNEPHVLARALAQGGCERITLVVAGPNAAAWREVCAAAGARVPLEVAGVVARTDAWHMQRDASALVLLDWRSSSAAFLTSKVFEYLFARAPILALGGEPASPMGALLRETGRGRHFGTDAAQLAAFLRALESGSAPDWPGRAEALEKYTRAFQSRAYLELMRARITAA